MVEACLLINAFGTVYGSHTTSRLHWAMGKGHRKMEQLGQEENRLGQGHRVEAAVVVIAHDQQLST